MLWGVIAPTLGNHGADPMTPDHTCVLITGLVTMTASLCRLIYGDDNMDDKGARGRALIKH